MTNPTLIQRNSIFFVLAVSIVAFYGCQSASAEPEEQTGVLLQASAPVAEAGSMEYLLYLPQDYYREPDRIWPVILTLHGSGTEDYDSAFLMSHGIPEVIFQGDLPAEFPFIVVAPQAYAGTTWWSEGIPERVIAVLDNVIANYRGDPARVYLTGVSMGGYGSWFLATDYPERFAAMASVSGSGYRTAEMPDPDLVCQLEVLPVWAFHGQQDMISDILFSKLAAVALQDCGGEVIWTQYEDAGHLQTTGRAYRDPSLYEWFLERSLK